MARKKKSTKKKKATKKRAAKKKATKKKTAKKRPRKTAKKKKGSKTAATASSNEELLTLTQVEKMTGISYPTLLRYTKEHLDEIPHVGSGRKKRYKPEAVAVFQRLRQQTRRGQKPRRATSGNLNRKMDRLEKGQKGLDKRLRSIERALKKPVKVTVQR